MNIIGEQFFVLARGYQKKSGNVEYDQYWATNWP
mgnify:CR=1 FL=1